MSLGWGDGDERDAISWSDLRAADLRTEEVQKKLEKAEKALMDVKTHIESMQNYSLIEGALKMIEDYFGSKTK